MWVCRKPGLGFLVTQPFDASVLSPPASAMSVASGVPTVHAPTSHSAAKGCLIIGTLNEVIVVKRECNTQRMGMHNSLPLRKRPKPRDACAQCLQSPAITPELVGPDLPGSRLIVPRFSMIHRPTRA